MPDNPVLTATPCVKRSQFIPGAFPGTFAVQLTASTVLSLQKDGTLETRPLSGIGPWESGQDQQGRWVVSDPAYPTGAYALLIVEA